MKFIPLFAGLIVLNSLTYAEVQEQIKEEKGEKTTVNGNENAGTFKIHENYPNPF